MINSEFVRSYCLDKFSNYRVVSSGRELIIPSIFLDSDPKRHMSINLESGMWRCFKTSNTGNFIKLYSIMEHIAYRKAYENFMFESFIREADETPQEELKTIKALEPFKMDLVDPEAEYDDYMMALAAEMICHRRMQDQKFYLAREGDYLNRLIIPFYNSESEMFFFQARGLTPQAYPKYLNAKNVKSSHVLYPYDYGSYDPLFVTEGVIDCLTLKQCGFNATTTLSCHTSNIQMEQLKHYPGALIAAFDTDSAGRKGTMQFLDMANRCKREGGVFFASPKGFKDWNEAYVSGGARKVKELYEETFCGLTYLDLSVLDL